MNGTKGDWLGICNEKIGLFPCYYTEIIPKNFS